LFFAQLRAADKGSGHDDAASAGDDWAGATAAASGGTAGGAHQCRRRASIFILSVAAFVLAAA